ncbi:hypothetical protein DDB_G0286983 [Dictyostelium discoideum AX4]|uniref:EGF-like domain-containing protein n=1 Tax=Dictyostelium discoideum TaxID=44689 RepID=Q54L10_DICDI|nr:hypothetical protein DDB_G0286983 [Dictyostelium discoideum AX4]EAL63989.1 hypothetical protein DDB_G0286983 [Dictyostelium discoideum AX4]|eukprot:XP_637493.1 hypothetical protein DDB_G0286983 [Dictyostelium discoideum AX4]
MEKKILLFLLILSISFNNYFVSSTSSSSSSSSECHQKIFSVSEVNPYNINSLVVIQGIFCLNSTEGIKVSLNVPEEGSNISYGLDCDDSLTIDSIGETITCRLSDNYSGKNAVNFTTLAIVMVYTPIPVPTPTPSKTPTKQIAVGPVPVLGTSKYIFTNSSCPSGCSENGFCDVGNTCRCNQNQASFDCSVRVYNQTSLPSPIVQAFNTFSMSSSNEQFSVVLSHIIANPAGSTSDISMVSQLSQYAVSGNSSSKVGLSFTLDGTTYTNGKPSSKPWLNQLQYDVGFTSVEEPSFSYENYKGAYLPLSSSAATITLTPTININYLPTVYYTTSGGATYSMIFKISNQHDSMSGYSNVFSETSNSITLSSGDGKNSLMVISLSDIYSFNQTTAPNHAYLSLLPNPGSSLISNYDSDSLYVSVNIPSIYSTNNQNPYTIQLNINVYDIDTSSHSKLPKWALGLIVGFSVFIGIVIIFIIAKYIKTKRHNYSRINDHHHHGHY